jgi:hypothetical protein
MIELCQFDVSLIENTHKKIKDKLITISLSCFHSIPFFLRKRTWKVEKNANDEKMIEIKFKVPSVGKRNGVQLITSTRIE